MVTLVVANCNFKNMQGSCARVPHTITAWAVVRTPGLHWSQLYYQATIPCVHRAQL